MSCIQQHCVLDHHRSMNGGLHHDRPMNGGWGSCVRDSFYTAKPEAAPG